MKIQRACFQALFICLCKEGDRLTEKLQEVRCIKCGKLLGKIKGVAEIKCTRCNTLNKFEK